MVGDGKLARIFLHLLPWNDEHANAVMVTEGTCKIRLRLNCYNKHMASIAAAIAMDWKIEIPKERIAEYAKAHMVDTHCKKFESIFSQNLTLQSTLAEHLPRSDVETDHRCFAENGHSACFETQADCQRKHTKRKETIEKKGKILKQFLEQH